MSAQIAIFKKKEIRKTIHKNEWWFVITDVVAALTDSVDPQGYIKDMRKRDPELSILFKGGGEIAPPPCARIAQTRSSRRKSAPIKKKSERTHVRCYGMEITEAATKLINPR
jgi:hypothetical protein